jgi:hypothetical protein
LLEILDNDEADNFVKALQGQEIYVPHLINGSSDTVEVQYLRQLAKVEAVWAAPTKFCECADYTGKSVTTKAYRWWVHLKCSKPRATAQQHPRNLLDPTDMDVRDTRYSITFMADRTAAWTYQAQKK